MHGQRSGRPCLIGLEGVGYGFRPVGLQPVDQASFDQTEMANLARSHFAPAPVSTARKADSNGLQYILIDVIEFEDVPNRATAPSLADQLLLRNRASCTRPERRKAPGRTKQNPL